MPFFALEASSLKAGCETRVAVALRRRDWIGIVVDDHGTVSVGDARQSLLSLVRNVAEEANDYVGHSFFEAQKRDWLSFQVAFCCFFPIGVFVNILREGKLELVFCERFTLYEAFELSQVHARK